MRGPVKILSCLVIHNPKIPEQRPILPRDGLGMVMPMVCRSKKKSKDMKAFKGSQLLTGHVLIFVASSTLYVYMYFISTTMIHLSVTSVLNIIYTKGQCEFT